MPPPEVVIILFPLKLTTLYLPKLPVCLPRKVAPNDSAASSIKIAPYCLHIFWISSSFAGVPYKFATITTFVFGYLSNAFPNATGSIFQVLYSLSINTGFPFSYRTGFTVAAKVMSEQNTLSPCLTPANFTAKCKAAVPEESATA